MALREKVDPNLHPIQQTYELALRILKNFFGPAWVRDHILDATPKGSFLSRDTIEKVSLNRHVVRVIQLAEMIFNLQIVSGFDLVLDWLRNGQLEASFAALEGGSLLHDEGVAFRFVTPLGRKKSDYAIEFFHPNGELCCADAKFNLETRTLSEPVIRNSLLEARKKLPTDKPGYLFVKVSPEWIDAPESHDAFREFVTRALEKTTRLVAIDAFANATTFDNGQVRHHSQRSEFQNGNHRFSKSVDWTLLARFEPASPPETWLSLFQSVQARTITRTSGVAEGS